MTEDTEPKPGKKARKLAASLAPVAETVGASVLEGDRLAPRIDTRGKISAIARQCGQLLRNTPLFLRGPFLVTVDEDTGTAEPMDATRFVTWAETFAEFGQHSGSGDEARFVAKSISSEFAEKILRADQFRRELRPLRGVHDVPLPTWANAERTAVRLLPPGYDEETGIFTAPAFTYRTDLPANEAWNFLLETFGDFPFAEGKPLEKNRSFAVLMAASFSIFARLLVLDCLRPAFVFLANQAGSGKTLLARLALAPVFGPVAVESFPTGEEERGKSLTTLVAEGRAYAFYDNVKGHLSSAELEGFLTSPSRTGRILGQSATVTAPNLATVFVSGNQLSLSSDLKRRVLVADLFCAREATEREFSSPITDSWPASPETRARFLAALWSLVNHWQAQGCPRLEGKPLPSFETFSAIIGGLVTTANFANPIAPPETLMDESEQAWKLVLRALADAVPTGTTKDYTSDEAMKQAEELGVLDLLTAGGRDERKTFGKRIKPWKGRRFLDNSGREFEFGNGRNRSSLGAVYPVTVFAKGAKA
jgi:hypothetical protein